jgi:hypothetical protein
MQKKEDRLISLISRVRLEKSDINRIKKLSQESLGWDYVFKESRREGVSHILYYHLNDLGAAAYIPRDIFKKLREGYYFNAGRNALILDETKRIFEKFRAGEIRAMALKGVFLAESIYKNIGLRPIGDMDVLICKEDLSAALVLLKSLGYNPPRHYKDPLGDFSNSPLNAVILKREGEDRFFLHLHWHLSNSTWPLDRMAQAFPMEEVWFCSESVQAAGIQARTLSPGHLIIYLASHCLNHTSFRLILFTDIFEAMRYYEDRICWEALFEEAKRFRLNWVLYYVIYFISYHFECEIEHLEKQGKENGFLGKIIRFCVERDLNFYAVSYMLYFLSQKGWDSKWRFLNKTLFPSVSVMADYFAVPSSKINVFHYLRRIFQYWDRVPSLRAFLRLYLNTTKLKGRSRREKKRRNPISERSCARE